VLQKKFLGAKLFMDFRTHLACLTIFQILQPLTNGAMRAGRKGAARGPYIRLTGAGFTTMSQLKRILHHVATEVLAFPEIMA
jgi:hypothetical protein